MTAVEIPRPLQTEQILRLDDAARQAASCPNQPSTSTRETDANGHQESSTTDGYLFSQSIAAAAPRMKFVIRGRTFAGPRLCAWAEQTAWAFRCNRDAVIRDAEAGQQRHLAS